MSDLENQPPGARPERPAVAALRSRRRFFELIGGVGTAAALSTLVAACGGGSEEAEESVGEPEPDNDLEIVQYALFLEFLEEQFYDEVRKSGQVQNPQIAQLVQQVYVNEKEHVEALGALVEQLGGTPVRRPNTDFTAVIEGGQDRIVAVSAEVENLGASAYLGQAAQIENLDILDSALAIHTVEARHAAAFNVLAGHGFRAPGELTGSVPHGAFAKPRTRQEVLELASPFFSA